MDVSDNEDDQSTGNNEIANDNDDDEQLLLNDLDHYIRTHGLRSADHSDHTSSLNAAEAAARAEEESKYQDSVHRSIFSTNDADKDREELERKEFLDSLQGKVVTVKVADGKSIKDVPLGPLAERCDTVSALARSRHLYGNHLASAASATTTTTTSAVDDANFDDDCKNGDEEKMTMELSLEQFSDSAVRQFLSLVVHDGAADDVNGSSSSQKKGRQRGLVENVPGEHIIEVCHVAHFLQSDSLVDDIANLIEQSIDSKNCLSICHLADRLHLPSLFESAIGHMLNTIDDMSSHELWDEFPKPLQNRILTMRNAIQSSILSKGRKAKVFFASSDEFLAIFSDNIREQRERLREAKFRQREVVAERMARRERDVWGGSVKDATMKLERQERRIRTLEVFYEEQKSIFAGGGLDGVAGEAGEGGGGGGKDGGFVL